MGILSAVGNAIITSALLGGLLFSTPDLGLGLALSVVTIVFALIGGFLQERMASERLKQVVACVLVALGIFLMVKTATELLV